MKSLEQFWHLNLCTGVDIFFAVILGLFLYWIYVIQTMMTCAEFLHWPWQLGWSLYHLCLDISFFPKFGKFYIIIYLNCLSIPVYFTSIHSSSHAPWSLRFALLNIILDSWKILSMLEKDYFPDTWLSVCCLCNTVSPSLSPWTVSLCIVLSINDDVYWGFCVIDILLHFTFTLHPWTMSL